MDLASRTIAYSSNVSKKTVNRVINKAKELNISWPLDDNQTDAVLEQILFPKTKASAVKKMPDFAYIRKELLKNGVSKKLLWTEYIEDCRLNNEQSLMGYGNAQAGGCLVEKLGAIDFGIVQINHLGNPPTQQSLDKH